MKKSWELKNLSYVHELIQTIKQTDLKKAVVLKEVADVKTKTLFK